MGFATTIKLGVPKNELSITSTSDGPDSIDIVTDNIETFDRNVSGSGFSRVFRRTYPTFTLNMPKVSEALLQKIMSLKRVTNTFLSFIWAGDWPWYSDYNTLDTTLTLTLPEDSSTRLAAAILAAGGTSADIITITGVFTTYDSAGGQAGTNYYSGGGSYDASTRIITLHSSPGPIGTVVYVNWTYKGALVRIKGAIKASHKPGYVGSTNYYDVTIPLEGV